MTIPTRILPLVSSQGKYPRGSDPWVVAAQRALSSLDPSDTVVLSSLGLPGWDILSVIASRLGLRLELILPGDNPGGTTEKDLLESYGLDPGRTVIFRAGGGTGKAAWEQRDKALFARAEKVLPISVRRGGRLEAHLDSAVGRGVEVDNGFSVPWSARNWRPRYEFAGRELNAEADRLLDGRLIHWTVSRSGPWPGESPRAFYEDLLAEPQSCVRDAASTLARIVRERLVRGSADHMPGARPGVSLTSLSPSGSVALMRWRSRYLRYTIEPFGLAFDKRAIEARGARPVRYALPDEPRPGGEAGFFVQGRGTRALWSLEQEWRLPGDLSLSDFGAGEVTLIAADPDSARETERRAGGVFRVLNLFAENVRI